MKKFAYLALAGTLALSGAFVAAPAMAAPSGADGQMFCSSSGSTDNLNGAKRELAQELQLRTKLSPTIEEWNGCLKVQYTDASGHNNVALYDPDSLKLVNQLS